MSALPFIAGLAVCLFILFRIIDRGFRNAREMQEENDRIYDEEVY